MLGLVTARLGAGLAPYRVLCPDEGSKGYDGILSLGWNGEWGMGKGDIRTRRGKIVRGTYGNKRRRKRKKTGDANKQ